MGWRIPDMMEGVSEDQLRSLVTIWGIGFVRVDSEYRITTVNNELLRIDGRSREELIGLTVWEAWPMIFNHKIGAIVREVMTKRTTGEGRFLRYERTDKKVVWLDFRVHPWADGIAIFTIDMTDQHHLEMELTDLERRYVLAARATTDVIYEWDVLADTIRISASGAIMFGAEEVITPGIIWWKGRLHPEDRERAVRLIENVFKSGATQWSDEYRFRMGEGQYALIYERGFVVYDGAGKPIRAVGAMADVTKIREAQDKVTQLQNELIHVSRLSAMGTMASAMAHELTQPLAAIGSYLAGTERLLMDEQAANIGLVLGAVRKAREGSSRAGQIIERMRLMTRKSEPRCEAVNVLKAVRDATGLVLIGRQHQAGQLTIDVPDTMVIEADLIQLEQVLMNLVKNAFEANDDTQGDEIGVIGRMCGGGQIEIVIEDRGPGVSDEMMEELFDFFMTTKKDGMGIGLPISRTIVEAHGGRIHVEKREGGGARFRLVLPIKQEEARMKMAQ